MVQNRSRVDDDGDSSHTSDTGGSTTTCKPPPGKTYLTIGQDFFSVQDYVLRQYNASLHRPDGHHVSDEVGDDSSRPASSIFPLTYFHPAATMVYTDIYQLKGLDQPADYGSGIEYAKGLADAFPESGLQIGLWLNGSQGCRDIVSGVLDDKVHRLFEFIQSELPQSLPQVFLRVGYEFDNPWFGYSDDPTSYQEAFQKLVRACERQMTPKLCHDKVDFVWHSWAAPRIDGVSLDQFYPGDGFVDWVGVSIFQQLYPWANDEKQNENGNFAGGDLTAVKEVLEFAKHRKKLIMVAESAPFGGMNVAESNVAKAYIEVAKNRNNIWNLWFQKIIDLIEEFDISMWSYINCDWGSQPMWSGIGFGDTRLSSSNVVMNQWWEQVLSNHSRFMLRIEGCGRQPYPTSGNRVKQEGGLTKQQRRTATNNGLTAIDGFDNNNRRADYFTLNHMVPYLLCGVGAITISIATLHLITMKITNSRAQKHRKETRSLTSEGQNTNYGSLK